MNDFVKGIVKGLSIGLFISEQNRKTPKRIEAKLLAILRELATDIGHNGIDLIQFEARCDRKSKLGK